MLKTCFKCKLSKDELEFNFRNQEQNIRIGTCKSCTYSKNYDQCSCGHSKRKIATLCKQCRNKERVIDSNYAQLTLGEKIYTKHKYAKLAYVRYYAKRKADELNFSCCRNCGYSKHFEVCHIKAISSFSDDTLLTTINSPENLLPLCPNCHYEFDNGKLTIEEINQVRA